ncbi:chondroitinase-AC [Pedobacter puniceum]|uniref:Chondroitinase n=1 Tax=Pedobacter puniceum TaxID=2666136 RepID=A0A7K0FN18_9SPHI|nr:chondroitinase-AC [Pedobacter puniceum]MRX46825.1 chondroitinase [Pedobacter puniceum]
MKKVFITLIFISFLPFMVKAQATYPFGTIMKRIFDDESKSLAKADAPAKAALDALQPDGSWSNINYQARDISNWAPVNHLEKIHLLIQAYVNKGGSYYNNKAFLDAIIKAYEYWYAKDPKSDNWWHNEISVPQRIGASLILLKFSESYLPEEFEKRLIERMKRGVVEDKTGANKTDIAMHYFYRALLTEDKDLLKSSLDQLFEPVVLTEAEEGLQHDYSYLQHGPQLYISGYGNVFIGGVTKIANYVKATPYALSVEKLEVFSKFYRQTFINAFRSRYIDFNVEGRGITRKGNLKKTSEKYRIQTVKSIDATREEEWENIRQRVDSLAAPDYELKPFHQHYWKGDYTQHVRPQYAFHVRIASNRTKRSESGNKENLYGRYLSDGATNIQVRGPEYFDIMPLWEWDKIPGTTSVDNPEDVLLEKQWGEFAVNTYAGGVSDGVYGATAYHLNYDGVTAKKAWFFFDQEIVCLGADIQSTSALPVTTTLNQAWLNGNIQLSVGKAQKKDELNEYALNNNSWVLHDGIAYYFPSGANVKLSSQKQTGTWQKINNSQPKNEISGHVFKLWINHGSKPRAASYNYVVLPAVKDVKSFNPEQIQTISNTAIQQVVYHKGLKILQAVLHEATEVKTDELSIKTDKPCVFMIKNIKGKKTLYVADPLQQEKQIKFSISDIKSGKKIDIAVDMPQKPYVGSSKEVLLAF